MPAPPRPLALSFVVLGGRDEEVGDAVAIATALRARGHRVAFAVARDMAGRVRAAGFTTTAVRGRAGVDRWLRATPADAVHVFGHGGVHATARSAQRLRLPLYWTVGDRVPAAVPPVGVLIAYSPDAARRLVAARRLRVEHVVVEPARLACAHGAADGVGVGAQRVPGSGDHPALRAGGGGRLVVLALPAEPATLPGMLQALAAVAGLRCEGHDVVLAHIGGGAAAPWLRRRLEACGWGFSLPPPAAHGMRADLLAGAVAVLASGRSAYEGMLADRPTMVLGANGYAGDCATTDLDVLAAYDFTGANVTRRDDRAGAERLMAALRPLLDGRDDVRRWLGARWARARVGADVAARSYEDLYVRRRYLPHAGAVALVRYDAARVAARSLRVAGRRIAPARMPRHTTRHHGSTGRATVVHAFADPAQPAAPAQVEVLLRLHAAGWTATLALPEGCEWPEVSGPCRQAGLPVVRVPVVRGPGPRGAAGWRRAAWLLRPVGVGSLLRPVRAAHGGAAVVHAHDDAAALLWGPAARRAGVPLVWDVDDEAAPALLDRLLLARASYLVVAGSGRRLATARRLPPHHRTPAPDDVAALAAAYQRLSGRAPQVPPGVDLRPAPGVAAAAGRDAVEAAR